MVLRIPATPLGRSLLDDQVLLLLVEDEALIRLNLEEELTGAGFALIVASNGRQALTEIETDTGRFSGVVTDIRLGSGPTGWDVARRARELAPGIPVIYVSGDSAHEWHSRGLPNSVMITKPFVTAQVLTAISTLLNQTSAA